jgi:hypothetical protein
MNTYKVTLNLTKDQLVQFIDHSGPFQWPTKIAPIQSRDESEAAPKAPVKARRGRKGSKVNDTIRSALQHGSQSIKELKNALEARGLSPGSLSTGLAQLQSAREVERVGDGVYALKVAEAAE